MTLYIIISVFVVAMLAGTLLDALLSDKQKKTKWGRVLVGLLPSPYNIMRLYAKAGDNLDDFTKAHAMSGLGFLGISVIVQSFAWWADQQVLYGMEYVATGDETFSLWQSVGIATLIQLILLFCGGMAFKLWVNGMHNKDDHKYQFRIQAFLGLVAFTATAYLSFQTDKIALKRGMQMQAKTKTEVKEGFAGKTEMLATELKTLRQNVATDSLRITQSFQTRKADLEKAFLADSIRYSKVEAGWAAGHIRNLRSKKVKKIAKERELALAKIEKVRSKSQPQIDKLSTLKAESVAGAIGKLDEAEKLTAANVEFNAQSTKGKNILLNIISLAFSLALQFYLRGAVKTEKAKREEDEDLSGPIPFRVGNLNADLEDGSGAGVTELEVEEADDDFVPPIPKGFDVEITDIPDSNPRQIELFDTQNKAKEDAKEVPVKEVKKPKRKAVAVSFNALEANSGQIESKVLANGEIMIKYYGRSKNEWQSYGKIRSALRNRVKKFKDAKSDKSRTTNLQWIRIFEERLSYIERHQTTDKDMPNRQNFNPAKPNAELFA